jgi:chromate transporter
MFVLLLLGESQLCAKGFAKWRGRIDSMLATPAAPPGLPAERSLPKASLTHLFLSFLRLGAVSFGGPAMVASIRRLAVTRKGWLSEPDFQRGVALCQAVPGSTAMQCAAYVGLRVRRWGGAVAAFVGFGLPAFTLMLALSLAYQHTAGIPAAGSVLTGLRALVVALVAHAAWIFGRSAIKSVKQGALALVTATLFFIGASPILILLGAALVGALALRGSLPVAPPTSRPSLLGVVKGATPLLLFALVPVAALFAGRWQLSSLGLSMMKVDLFAFGGGLASLPIMYREAVQIHHWVSPSVFMDGIALGQATPGPIIITATFIGHRVAGLAGAVIATGCIFAPSLAILLVAEPWFLRLSRSPVFVGVTSALVLCFVGLLASVTLQLGRAAPWSPTSGLIAVAALAALLAKVDVVWVVLVGATLSAMLL